MSLTGIVLLSVTGVLLLFEGYALLNRKPNDTESEGIRAATIRYPVLALFAGTLCGHWFIPRCGEVEPLVFLALMTAAVVMLVAAFVAKPHSLPQKIAAGFLTGLLAGYLFWPLCVDPTRGALRTLAGVAWRT